MIDDQIKSFWLYMNENWPNYEIPSSGSRQLARIKVWRDLCGDLDPELIRAAIASLASRDFPPTPGQIREAAVDIQRMLDGGTDMPGVDEAWLEFKSGYKTRGPWSHPAVEAAARALGCREYGMSEVSEEMAWRAHFIKLYGSASQRFTKEVAAPPALASFMAGVLKRAPQSELTGGDAA